MTNISFNQAYQLVTNTIVPLPEEAVPVDQSVGRTTSRDIVSSIDSPSADVSLKDGYAVVSTDLYRASPRDPVILDLIGTQFAGTHTQLMVAEGKTIKVTSGAIIPAGADGVLSNEFAEESDNIVSAYATVGNNILRKGTDIAKGAVVVARDTTLMPTHAGLIAAAGHATAPVYKQPFVTIIATGEEIVAVGKPVGEGKIAASNLVTIAAWCNYFHLKNGTMVVPDSHEALETAINQTLPTSDCIVTSGGAWSSERDFAVRVFDSLGWEKKFHRVKIGPGKAVAFGLLRGKPIFCLPGGPPSNQMAFLQLALPGIRLLEGHRPNTLPRIPAVLEAEVRGQRDWTQFEMGLLRRENGVFVFSPRKLPSRLQSLSNAHGIITIPEGTDTIEAGSKIDVQIIAYLPEILDADAPL
ncbi:MAG: molybdopterin molybdotransferase MoeA [Deltaproteobacteria bacterium]|nr:molybdopterin molybdotransferase MoeA [Deltaproteobacteria bacterium]